MLSAMKLSLILFGLSRLLKFAAWRHPAFQARLKERNLIAQIMARDEEIGRWFEFQDGKVTLRLGRAARRRRHGRLQERRARRRPADAADQLARPDQRAEGLRAHRRRARGPHQLVRADRDDEPDRSGCKFGTPHAGRLDALLQHDQRRAGLRLRQGRQDRPHDADRPRRRRRAAVDDRGARARSSRRRARPRSRRTARTPSRSSIRPTACSIR